MPNNILLAPQASATFTITLASLASGTSRQSDLITNSGQYPAAMIFFKITSGGSAPTAGLSYDIFLLLGDAASPNVTSDNAGASDAAITILNSRILGSISVTASSATAFYGVFDTSRLGPLGPRWGIAVRNSSGQALSSTESDHVKRYYYYNPVIS